MKFKEKMKSLKDRMKSLYEENKPLMMTAIILNVVFMIVAILSLCGLNIAKLSAENEFLTQFNNWVIRCDLLYIVYGIIFASNVYFAIAVSSNDYTSKPLIFTICLLPVFVALQYCAGLMNTLILSFLIPFCVCVAYSFKFSTMWKSILFFGIVTIYQYLMQITKLSIFGFEYLNASLVNYIFLSIDLYVVFIFYFCICKTIYKNKLEKEEK